MATDEQRSRRRAQRATARRVKESRGKRVRYQKILPKAITGPSARAQVAYANDVLSGKIPYPKQGSSESKQLARMASFARWNKADPNFLTAFHQYFYHDERQQDLNEDDREEMADYEEGEEEE